MIPSKDSHESRRVFVLNLLTSLALESGHSAVVVRWMLEPYIDGAGEQDSRARLVAHFRFAVS